MFKKMFYILISICYLITPIEISAETNLSDIQDTQTTYNFNYSNNEDFSIVLQTNIDKMEGILKDTATTYSAEFVVDYITPSRDYNQVVDTLNKVQEISNDICSGISSDYEKMQKIHDYVCKDISYDHVSAENSADFNTICLMNVMDNKKTICAGYSNLFSALCNAQGLYCINIRGSARTNEFPNLGDDNSPTNHEWTAVWYDEENRWVFVDCTWDSQNDYYENGFSYQDFKSQYFDMSMEEMSVNHKIKIIDHRNFFDAINYFDITQNTTIPITTGNSIETTQQSTTVSTNEYSYNENVVSLQLIIGAILVLIGTIVALIIFRK